VNNKRSIASEIVCWRPEAKKLVFLKEKPTAGFWDRQWQNNIHETSITQSRRNRYWLRLLTRYLPDKTSRILEGGCGYGHLVDAMNCWGYRVTGVDFASKTVERIKEIMPHLDIRLGDVRALNFEDGYFDGYLSAGVIEHFWEGYEDVMQEMRRILRPGGYAFVCFPCISRLDKLKILCAGYKNVVGSDMPEDFYQFGLDIDAVRKDFERAGFRCVRINRRNGWLGLKRLWPMSETIHEALIRGSQKKYLVKLFTAATNRLLAPLCGHSVLLVLKKQ